MRRSFLTHCCSLSLPPSDSVLFIPLDLHIPCRGCCLIYMPPPHTTLSDLIATPSHLHCLASTPPSLLLFKLLDIIVSFLDYISRAEIFYGLHRFPPSLLFNSPCAARTSRLLTISFSPSPVFRSLHSLCGYFSLIVFLFFFTFSWRVVLRGLCSGRGGTNNSSPRVLMDFLGQGFFCSYVLGSLGFYESTVLFFPNAVFFFEVSCASEIEGV